MLHCILLESALFCQPLCQTTKLGTLYNSLCDQFVGSHEGQKLGTLCNSLCDQYVGSHEGQKLGTLCNSLCDQFVGSHEGQKLGTLCNSLCDQFVGSHKRWGGLWDELGLYNPLQVKTWYYKVTLLHVSHVFGLNQHRAPVTQLVEHGGEFDSGRTTTQSPKITEEKVLPLQLHQHIVRLSSLLGYRTIKRRSRFINKYLPCSSLQCGTLKNPNTIREEYGMKFLVLWLSFVVWDDGLGRDMGIFVVMRIWRLSVDTCAI